MLNYASKLGCQVLKKLKNKTAMELKYKSYL